MIEVFENQAFMASLGAEKAEAKGIVEVLPFVNASNFCVFLTTDDEKCEWRLPQDLTEQVMHYIKCLVIHEAYLFTMSTEVGCE